MRTLIVTFIYTAFIGTMAFYAITQIIEPARGDGLVVGYPLQSGDGSRRIRVRGIGDIYLPALPG